MLGIVVLGIAQQFFGIWGLLLAYPVTVFLIFRVLGQKREANLNSRESQVRQERPARGGRNGSLSRANLQRQGRCHLVGQWPGQFLPGGDLPVFSSPPPGSPQGRFAVKILLDGVDQSKFPIGG